MELTHQAQPGEEHAARIDLDQMTNNIWEEMKGRVDKRTIQQALTKILPDYQGARIPGFVPILVRRDVLEMLIEETRTASLSVSS